MDSFAQSNTDTDNCSVCKENGTTVPATRWCSECEASLCDACLKCHNKMPISRHHGVSDLSGEKPRIYIKKKFICKEHDKKIKLFCKDCKKTLCTICCSIHHRACKDVVTIQDMLPEVKQNLADRQKKLLNYKDKTSRNATEIRVKIEEFVAKSANAETEIKQKIRDTVCLLQQKETLLLDKLKDMTNTQTRELKAEVKSEEITIQMYQQQSQFIQQALTFEDEAQLFGMFLSSDSGAVGDIKQAHTEGRSTVSDISFVHNMERLREDIDKMDVTICDVCDDVIDLTATPSLIDVVEMTMVRESGSGLRDVAIVNIKGGKSIVVTDNIQKRISSVYVDKKTKFHSHLKVDSCPWSVAVLSRNKIIVSLQAKVLLTIGVNPDLVLLSTITTSKQYQGLAVLDELTVVAGSTSPPSVDVVDMTGNVLRSFTAELIMEPRFLHVTSKGNILVSEYKEKAVLCLEPNGDIAFTYEPTGERALGGPRGITSTKRGDVVFADLDGRKLTVLSPSGEFVMDILKSQDGICDIVNLTVDGDILYVVTVCNRVYVYMFSWT